MAVVNEVSTVSHIPQFVPFGLLYYTQDTGDLYIGTGFSTGSDYVGGNPGPNVNVELISSPGGLPGGFNGDIQYNNNGNLGGSAATITAAGAINALSITATSATIGALTATAENIVTSTITSAFITTATVTSTLELQTATIVDSLGSTGTVGQALESTGTGVKWAAVSSTETWAALTGAMTATQVAPWYNATSTIDSGISRLGAASVALGNGTAGDFTGSLSFNKVIKYAGVATVSAGVPSEIATVDLTAQSAAITATTLYSVPAAGAGMYRITWVAMITTAGTTSALGGTNGFQISFTSPTDSVVKTDSPTTPIISAANTTGTSISGCEVVYAKASTNIQYAFGYSSSGTTMVYELHCKCEYLG